MGSDLFFLHGARGARCRAFVDKHFDGYHTLQFMRRGAVELFYDNRRELVEAPALWTCWPGPRIRFHAARGSSWNHRYIAFRGAGVSRFIQDGLFFFGVCSCPSRHALHCAQAMDEIIRLAATPGLLPPLRAANLLEALLLDVAAWRQAASGPISWLKTVTDALEQTTVSEPDYEALARQSGMALSTLRRRFRRETGLPLHRYTLELRMAEARRLVAATQLPLKDIADRLGYDNVFYFSRQFRKFHSVPPALYRRSRQH